MLAMVANDDAGNLIPRGALVSIASMLAPTGFRVQGSGFRRYNRCTDTEPAAPSGPAWPAAPGRPLLPPSVL